MFLHKSSIIKNEFLRLYRKRIKIRNTLSENIKATYPFHSNTNYFYFIFARNGKGNIKNCSF